MVSEIKRCENCGKPYTFDPKRMQICTYCFGKEKVPGWKKVVNQILVKRPKKTN